MGVSLLLDTHTLLWALLTPELLSSRVRELVLDRSNMVLVSAGSAWEIGTKHRLGKLDEAGEVVDNYADHLARLEASEVPITSAHALTAGRFDVAHRDPFDRVIAAQSLLLGVPVASKDEALDLFPCRRVW